MSGQGDFDSQPTSPVTGSVTRWIRDVQKQGAGAAQQQILQRYWGRLTGLARVKLRGSRKRIFDEEEVVSKTLYSFFEAAQAGKCPDMANRDDLWSYLVRVAERKAIDLIREEGRAKRGCGKLLGEQTAFGAAAEDASTAGLENLPCLKDPSPEFAETFVECCYDWLDLLDEEERIVAIKKGQGYTNREIAEAIGRVERSVERKLKSIRSKLANLERNDEKTA